MNSRSLDRHSGFTKAALMIWLAGCLAANLSAQGNVTFKDDVKQHVTRGDKTDDVKVTVTLSDTAITIRRNAKDETVIDYASISSMSYDRRAKQRKFLGVPSGAGYAPKLQHFLTIQFKRSTAGDFVELELGKNVAPRLVATLEAKSGKPIEKIAG
jgi:hypothetical protein